MMNTTHRRIALLTGASAAALGLALPAQAQEVRPEVRPHDTMAPGIYPGAVATANTVEICDLDTPATDPCFFGVIVEGTPAALATVNTIGTGQVRHTPTGPGPALLTNNDVAEHGAIAIATGPAANANAQAFTLVGQTQLAGLGDVDLTIDNDGTWIFDAVATAVADTGLADADALLNVGLRQEGTGADVALAIINDGDMYFLATANAAGAAGANANATITTGLLQMGAGDTVALSLVNNGTMVVAADAEATATAGPANAVASVDGVRQEAVGATFAAATYDNNGLFVVTADAEAIALAGVADASAYVTYGLSQEVDVVAGTGVAVVTNDGTMTIGAYAFASGTAGASADAEVGIGIDQDVNVAGDGSASAQLNNNNEINVSAIATAISTAGNAFASATITNEAIDQNAFVGGAGTATASVVNAGTLDVVASANASGAMFASASADIEGVIEQSAMVVGAGTAAVFVSNTTAGVINALATANAVGTVAFADASADDVIQQDAFVGGAGTAVAGINNAGAINVDAVANASATTFAVASAEFGAPLIAQDVNAPAVDGNAVAVIDNSGTIDINATASAVATQGTAFAIAGMNGDFAIEQNVVAGGTAVASFTNTGVVNLGANAAADGHNVFARADMAGVLQEGTAPLVGLNFVNGGTMAVDATASANGSTAVAIAVAQGNRQEAVAATSAVLYASNTGLISVSADAFADGVDYALAIAVAGSGMVQDATAPFVSESMINTGTVALAANATATAGQLGSATAIAVAYDAMAQYANAAGTPAGTAVQFMSNAGLVSLSATADAVGAGDAYALAVANTAMYQSAQGGTVTQSMINAGTVTATANANAVANGAFVADTGEEMNAGGATATAVAFGMGQRADGAAASQTMTNSGTLNVGAHAQAAAPAEPTAEGTPAAGVANAFALATGAYQVNNAAVATMAFSNATDAVINVNASAVAIGTTGTASAYAIGYSGYGGGGGPLTVTIVNNGTMNVSATAVAAGTAFAQAQGIVVENEPTPIPDPLDPLAPPIGFAANPINGTITNNGVINVTASASGGVASTALATGIAITGGVNNMVVTNTGLISVDAIVANGGNAEATGVLVGTNGDVAPLATDVFTFTNDGGTIIVRESVDGGATWRRGTAIDVAGAPNASVINLLGDGTIYGNIDINEGDNIFVEAGTTYFDGIINPECHEDYGGPGPAYDNPAVNACGQGTLTIQNGGNLYLADSPFGGDPTMYDGPSYVFVDTFNVAADGTITFQLTPEKGGAQPIGTYPQVFADVANLDGTLVADLEVAGGLFANNYFYNNVIDAVVRNGTFDQCIIAGDLGNSALIDLDCIYDDQANVDLGITRIAFDAVGGLTDNQRGVAGGLECIYGEVGPAGLIGTPTGALIAELFLFDGTEYPLALEQLTGAGYAGYLQSFNSLGYHYNQILARATDCEVPALAGSALACRVAPIHLWGQVDYDTLRQDGDQELGDYDADRWSFLVGLDFSVTPASVIGVSLGKVNNKVEYEDVNTRIKGKGWQFGLYGTFDPGAFYLKALGTYTRMDGDARRDVDFAPFGGTIAGRINGDPDTRMWTVGFHGGARLPMGATSVITPFLNYDYTNVRLKSFGEDGLPGANLRIDGGREVHSWLTGGVKFAGQMGGLVPEAMLAYRYMFGDRRASFNAAFDGFEECDFDIVSMTEKRGSILAGLSIGGMLGGIDVRVGYLGAFNENAREHSGFLKLVVPLGAVAAPPPPPVVIAPPPPPPPATQTCPDGSVILATDICPAPPPPPPPPPPAPERG